MYRGEAESPGGPGGATPAREPEERLPKHFMNGLIPWVIAFSIPMVFHGFSRDPGIWVFVFLVWTWTRKQMNV